MVVPYLKDISLQSSAQHSTTPSGTVLLTLHLQIEFQGAVQLWQWLRIQICHLSQIQLWSNALIQHTRYQMALF